MGFLTNLLNPKIAVMYLSLLPQFLHPQGHGSVLMQSLVLGFTQIAVSVSVNAVIEALPLAWARDGRRAAGRCLRYGAAGEDQFCGSGPHAARTRRSAASCDRRR